MVGFADAIGLGSVQFVLVSICRMDESTSIVRPSIIFLKKTASFNDRLPPLFLVSKFLT
jgi:hypothetical protein